MFDHFGQRLKRDLKNIVDQRITRSETVNNSTIRVRYYYLLPDSLSSRN